MAAVIILMRACAEAKQCGEGNTAAGSADSSGAQLLPHGRAVPRPQLCAAHLHGGPCRHCHCRAGFPHPGSIHGKHSYLSLAQLGPSVFEKIQLLCLRHVHLTYHGHGIATLYEWTPTL